MRLSGTVMEIWRLKNNAVGPREDGFPGPAVTVYGPDKMSACIVNSHVTCHFTVTTIATCVTYRVCLV